MGQSDPYDDRDPEPYSGGMHDPYPDIWETAGEETEEDRERIAAEEAAAEGAQDARERLSGVLLGVGESDLQQRLEALGAPEEVDGPDTPPSSPNDPQGGVGAGSSGANEGESGAGTDPGPSASLGTATVSGGIRRYGRLQIYFSNPALAISGPGGSLARASMASVWFGGTDETPDGFEDAKQTLAQMYEASSTADGWVYMEVPLDGFEGHPGEPSTRVMIRAGAIDYLIVEEGAAPRVE